MRPIIIRSAAKEVAGPTGGLLGSAIIIQIINPYRASYLRNYYCLSVEEAVQNITKELDEKSDIVVNS